MARAVTDTPGTAAVAVTGAHRPASHSHVGTFTNCSPTGLATITGDPGRSCRRANCASCAAGGPAAAWAGRSAIHTGGLNSPSRAPEPRHCQSYHAPGPAPAAGDGDSEGGGEVSTPAAALAAPIGRRHATNTAPSAGGWKELRTYEHDTGGATTGSAPPPDGRRGAAGATDGELGGTPSGVPAYTVHAAEGALLHAVEPKMSPLPPGEGGGG